MNLILQINTALDTASISLAQNGNVIAESQNNTQKEHASFLQIGIREMLQTVGVSLRELSAVAVILGPGSYTGLRVGMAGAKGICFGLSIPLITVNTLEWMAEACKNKETDLVCPMIDARRMEVFLAWYSRNLEEISTPEAIVLDPSSFSDIIRHKKTLFLGNGAKKFSTLISHPNAIFIIQESGAGEFAKISWKRYQQGLFANLAYTEPLYVKDFYTAAKQ